MLNPLVTAVLVCWNHERFVRQAVLSALQQSYRNIELIVIDNGSTDGSRKELELLASEHEFRLICQQNIGVVGALNQGLALAKGQYFAPLATDDVWMPNKIERQVRYLEENPDVHMLGGSMLYIDESGQQLDRQITLLAGERTFSGLMRSGCTVYGPTVMCRVSTLRQLGGYDNRSKIEDYAAALCFTQAGYRVMVLEEVYTQYRRHGNNWTGNPVWSERLQLGHIFRSTPEYGEFVRHNLRGYFRDLAGSRKRAALHLLLNEPIAWTWNDVGVGLVKLMTPHSILRRMKRHRTTEHVA